MILHNQFSSVSQPGPVNAESTFTTSTVVGGAPIGNAILSEMISPAAYGGTLITVEIPSIGINQAETFDVRQELLYIRPPSRGSGRLTDIQSEARCRLELDRTIAVSYTHLTLPTTMWV